MGTFIALPVGQGDAFCLKRDGKIIVVDGGRARKGIVDIFQKSVKTSIIDYLICTHNDADHACGVLGLLENSDITVKEVWLPGSWQAVLKTIIESKETYPIEILNNVINKLEKSAISVMVNSMIRGEGRVNNEINQFWGQVNDLIYCFENIDGSVLDTKYDSYSDFFNARLCFLNGSDNLKILASSHDTGALLKQLSSNLGRLYNDYSPQDLLEELKNLQYKSLLMSGRVEVFTLVTVNYFINMADRVARIARRAIQKGCHIRFFEYNLHQSLGGALGILEPVNSQEISKFPTFANADILDYLALTIDNKQSLVFYSPESQGEGAVLFCADSDLSGVSLNLPRPSNNILITSPHHGSESNTQAYQIINEWLGDKAKAIWVRSDSRSKSRPGQIYKQQKNRYCTRCRTSWQARELYFSFGNQGWCSENKECIC